MDVKKTLIAIILSLSMTNFGHALEFDATIDDEIRKNYNPNKLVNDTGVNNSALDKSLQADVMPPSVDINLPELPNITKTGTTTKTPDVKTTVTTSKYTPYRGGNIRIKEGTSLDVISIDAISDWQTAGTQVKFINKKNICHTQ